MKKVLVCAGALALAQAATAGVTINIVENAGNVEATLSGKIDKNALGSYINNSTGYNGFYPPGGGVSFTFADSEYFGISAGTWTPYGGGGFDFWDSSSGDAFHMFTNPVLGLPVGYTSNSPLSASAAKFNTNFANLGFTPGTYITTLVNGNFTDTVTVNIGVPAPGAAALLGVAGLASVRRRR